MSTSDMLFQRLGLALLWKRPIHLGHHRPFCCPVLSASGHVPLKDLTVALIRQMKQAWWLPLIEVLRRAGCTRLQPGSNPRH